MFSPRLILQLGKEITLMVDRCWLIEWMPVILNVQVSDIRNDAMKHRSWYH
jgi:hypothetical protein